jgi:predicted DCC family thiol-disulfide oxidoreductase YuxK
MLVESPPPSAPPVNPYEVEVFFDGDCPLCRREISLLKRWDKRERIRFTDIAAAGFDPAIYGMTQDRLMAEIHGRDTQGNWLVGVEVFRRLYAAVGFEPLVAATRWPLIRHALDAAYRLFAPQRLRLTGRCRAGACPAPNNGTGRPTT